jgi:hypothetical protein
MDVDFSNSRNATILRYLRNPHDFIMGPEAGLFHEARERDLAAGRVRNSQSSENLNCLNLGTHPDLVERLWREITVSLPEACPRPPTTRAAVGSAFSLEPRRDRQPLIAQELRIPELRVVARAGIGEDRHDRVPRTELPRQAHGPGHVDSRRAAEEEALVVDEVEEDRQRLLIGDLVRFVYRRSVHVRGDATLADQAVAYVHGSFVLLTHRPLQPLSFGTLRHLGP